MVAAWRVARVPAEVASIRLPLAGPPDVGSGRSREETGIPAASRESPWGIVLRNASRSRRSFEPGACSAEGGVALQCVHAGRCLQEPVLSPADGRGPAAGVRREGVERAARLQHARETVRGVRERRSPATPRRRPVAGALPRRHVVVPGGASGVPVQGGPVHGASHARLYRVAVPGSHASRGVGAERRAAPGAAGGVVQRGFSLDGGRRRGGADRAGR